MKNQKPKPDDAISKPIPCECGKSDCKMGLIITKYPEDKIKVRIFDKDEIKTVVIDKKKLMEQLKGLK